VIVARSSGGGPSIAPGEIVRTEPLTSGYRVVGKVRKHGAASITVRITRVDSSAGEARNVALIPGKEIVFERPVAGSVTLARNGHLIPSAAGLKDGDTITVVGEFTSVQVPPGAPHDGYSYIGVEATSR